MPKFLICTEAFTVTAYDNAEDEAKAMRYGAMPFAEVQKLVEREGLQVPRGEDLWFRAGQRVPEDHRIFRGQSGENRKRRLFIPEEQDPDHGGGLDLLRRGPGRPRKVEAVA